MRNGKAPPKGRKSLAVWLVVIGVAVSLGVGWEQSKIGSTQEYTDYYGQEIPLNRPVPPPTIQTIELSVEMIAVVVGGAAGAIGAVYSNLSARIDRLSDSIGDGATGTDSRMDRLTLELEKLRGIVALLESKLGSLTKQVENDRTRSDRVDGWIRAQVNEIQRFLVSQGFRIRDIDLIEPPTGAFRPPTPPPTQGDP